MKILQISTSDVTGGAAIACHRLTKGLRRAGEVCDMLVRFKTTSEDHIHSIWSDATHDPWQQHFPLFDIVRDYYINNQRTEMSNTLFSLSYSGYDLSDLDLVRKADVINLHWVVDFQSPQTIAKIAALGKPIIWTLHDQWPFTGGCHYSAGCTKYRSDCSSCPQLSGDVFNVTSALVKDKAYFFKNTPITIVTPSLWLSECARESAVFRTHRIETIPNSLDTDIFNPIEKETARKNLGLQAKGLILLFGSENGNEKRKGFKELLSAIRTCMESKEFSQMARDREIIVICFGQPARELETSGIKVIPLGILQTDDQLRNAYCAADIFILPSLDDNLPNTMLESMSCGTPVISFNVGGMPDVIINDQTGLTVPANDTKALGNAIVSLCRDSKKRVFMSHNCRTKMVDHYSLEVQARNYLALYSDLQKSSPPFRRNTSNMQDIFTGTNVVRVDTSVGPHFDEKYAHMIFKSFQMRLDKCEFDRTARCDLIHFLNKRIESLRKVMHLRDRSHGNKFLMIVAKLIRTISRLFRKVSGI